MTGTYRPKILVPGPELGRILPLNINDRDAVLSLMRKVKPDVIFHLAAQSIPRFSWAKQEETFQTNVGGTIHLLEAMRRFAPGARFLFPSSIQVYGRTFRSGRAAKESDPLWPEHPYAASKIIAEYACLDFARRFDLDVLIVRAFNHLGTGQPSSLVFSDWCRQIALAEKGEQEPILEVGNLEARRDFLHVEDVVRGYELLMRRGKKGTVYNLCSGKARPLTDYAQFLLKRAGVRMKIKVQKNRLRRDDPPVMKGDPSRLKALGWRPRRSPFEALEELLNEWRRKLA